MTTMVAKNQRSRGSFIGFVNLLLLLLQFFCALAVTSTLAMRETYEEISAQTFGEGAPLMGSPVADLVIQPWLAILLVPLLGLSIWKERRINSARVRAVQNLMIILALMAVQFGLIVLIYGPASEARLL